MIKTTSYRPTNRASGTSDDLHLSGLLTGCDPAQSASGSTGRRGTVVRPQARLAQSAPALSRTAAGIRPIPPADPLAELGMISAVARHGGIGAVRHAPVGRRVPMGILAVMVVTLATALGVFVCRKPLQKMVVFGPPPPVVRIRSARSVAKTVQPSIAHAGAVADSSSDWWKTPTSAQAATVPTAPVFVSPAQAHPPTPAHPVVRPAPQTTPDYSQNPPGALFTHTGHRR